MSPAVRKTTNADQQVEEAIARNQSFVLDAGAGSGKTSSLVTALRVLGDGERGKVLARNDQKVACITFTNVAKDEIIERTGRNQIIVSSTIHDFLWEIVKPHQPALKRALLIHNAALDSKSKRKRDQVELEEALNTVKVFYQDRGSEFLEGRIFHDDLLEVAQVVFQENPLMAKIAAAKFPYIFVDEYQDTNISVVRILLEHVLPSNTDQVVVGFFGDKMQNIYDAGVGEIPASLRQRLIFIPKEENYRCSKAVIGLLNKVRNDIKQVPAGDNAPGAVAFIRLTAAGTQDVLTRARQFVVDRLGWDLSIGSQRDLFLTHRLIAKRAGYDELLEIYQKRGAFTRDQLLSGEDPLIKFLHLTIEPLIAAWAEQKVGQVLSIIRSHDFRLDEVNGKTKAKAALDRLLELYESSTVMEVLKHLDTSRLLLLPDDFKQAIDETPDRPIVAKDAETAERERTDREFIAAVLGLRYAQVSSFCRYLEEHTPFSTQHGVKGTEYDTVFVILDDKGAAWNMYSFDKYLNGEDEAGGKTERHRRTRNLFYVSCSRSKRNLAVIDLGGSDAKKDARIKNMFGAENSFL